MKQNVLISVIIPVYNVEKYISKCIESVLAQDYENFECILVDDGSKDKSGKICDNYAIKDKRIRVIHKKNEGVSKARNCGLNTIKGDYVCFIDGDDYVKKNYVSHLYKIAIDNDADVALTTNMFGNYSKRKQKKDKCWLLSGEEAVKSILNYKIPIGCYNKLFKKKIFKQGGVKFYEDLKIGEGFSFNISCFLHANKVACSNQKIYYYRRDNQTSAMSSYSEKKADSQMYSMEKIKCQLDNAKIDCWNEFKYAQWRTESDLYDLIIISNKKDSKWLRQIRKGLRRGFLLSLKCDVCNKDRLRALAFLVYPGAVPFIMKLRKRIYIK